MHKVLKVRIQVVHIRSRGLQLHDMQQRLVSEAIALAHQYVYLYCNACMPQHFDPEVGPPLHCCFVCSACMSYINELC